MEIYYLSFNVNFFIISFLISEVFAEGPPPPGSDDEMGDLDKDSDSCVSSDSDQDSDDDGGSGQKGNSNP